jgi:hypothetical protein
MNTDKNKIKLARRAVACKGWRWMPGMRSGESWRVCSVGDCLVLFDERGGGDFFSASAGHLPDLDDPATLGCLLALVRVACPGFHIDLWCDTDLAEALVAALEDTPVSRG